MNLRGVCISILQSEEGLRNFLSQRGGSDWVESGLLRFPIRRRGGGHVIFSAVEKFPHP